MSIPFWAMLHSEIEMGDSRVDMLLSIIIKVPMDTHLMALACNFYGFLNAFSHGDCKVAI